jgi:hypothetical protein
LYYVAVSSSFQPVPKLQDGNWRFLSEIASLNKEEVEAVLQFYSEKGLLPARIDFEETYTILVKETGCIFRNISEFCQLWGKEKTAIPSAKIVDEFLKTSEVKRLHLILQLTRIAAIL